MWLDWLRRRLGWSPGAPPAPAQDVLAFEDHDAIVRTLWGEARGQPHAGQVAVVHVIRNRAKAKGMSPYAVCHAPAQFSCWWDAQAPHLRALSPKELVFTQLGTLVDGAWAMPDTTGGATHYFAPAGMKPPGRVPLWAVGRKPSAVIGEHVFYSGIPW